MGVDMNVVASTPQERLQERLSDPRTVESLNHLLDRLDVIAFSFDAVEGFLSRAEVVIESLSAGVAALRPTLQNGEQEGADWLERVPQLARTGARLAEVAENPALDRLLNSGLLEKLAEPQTLDSLTTMLDKLELVAFMLESVDGFLARGDSVAESLAEGAADLKRSLPDTKHLKKAAERVPDLVEAGEALADAGMFEPSTVQVLGQLGRTIAESHLEADQRERKTIGVFGLLKALRDPQIQNTLGLALDIAERYGAELEKRQG